MPWLDWTLPSPGLPDAHRALSVWASRTRLDPPTTLFRMKGYMCMGCGATRSVMCRTGEDTW